MVIDWKPFSLRLKDIRVGVFLISQLRVLKNFGAWKEIENRPMFLLQSGSRKKEACLVL